MVCGGCGMAKTKKKAPAKGKKKRIGTLGLGLKAR